MFKAYHNSQDLFYRDPFGAVVCGRKITFRLITFTDLPVKACVLRLWAKDNEVVVPLRQITQESREGLAQKTVVAEEAAFEPLAVERVFEGEYEMPVMPGLVWYYFVIRSGWQTYYYGNNPQSLGGEGCLWDHEPPAYQITVHGQMTVPKWYKRGVMYQIFMDRFFNPQKNRFVYYPKKGALLHTDWFDLPVYIKDEKGRVTDWDFFGGTLEGVRKKIPYLKELGVTILYFNPIFEAQSNHKYDTADYLRIDPMFGNETVFKRLLEEAEQAGIRIILDGVFSHTGSDSIYFNKYGAYPNVGAYQSADSPYYEWFKFVPDAREYISWWGVDSLPEVDEMNPSYRQFIYGDQDSVVRKWLKFGVAGWRLDVADELPDEFIRELRQAVKSARSDAVLIGEVWEDASNKVSYDRQREYLMGNELDATMNYPFRTAFLRFMLGQSDASALQREVMSLYENYPRESFYAAMNLIGSHDTIRILTLLGEAPAADSLTKAEQRIFRLSQPARQLAVRRLKLISLVQMTYPGVPCVYYGDEAGVEGYADPYNRATYPWGKEDREILDWYRRILRLRAEYETLLTGDFASFSFDPDVYGFRRASDKEEMIVLLNRHAEETKTVDLNGKVKDFSFTMDLISGESMASETLKALSIGPLEAKVLFRNNRTPNLRLERSGGILMHISSLPSAWGSGDLGQEAYAFADFLAESGQSLWQVLPLNPTGFGDSPYQSDSVFAGNPDFISLDHLCAEGLLDREEAGQKLVLRRNSLEDPGDFNQVSKELKRELLRKAYQRFRERMAEPSLEAAGQPATVFLAPENYLEFQKLNRDWLPDYALFLALKAHFGNKPWYEWRPELAFRESEKLAEYRELLREELEYNQFLQYAFFFEWAELKKYAGSKNIRIIGDLPHFVAGDSCDVWVNPGQFALDKQGRPAEVAGVPPDYFSKTGQLWGNPVYDWESMAVDHYEWWRKRISFSLQQFDYIRLDHFRGFEAFWVVDAGQKTAENGCWRKGPGKRFFEVMTESLGPCPFIVEDLGFITPEVNVLKHIFAYPGVKVLQFTPLSDGLGDGMTAEDINYVYYTGTHDNSTLLGWYEENCWAEEESQGQELMNCDDAEDGALKCLEADEKQACRKLMEEVYACQAVWVILPMQDILGLGNEARMNVPGTVEGNWQWRLTKDQVTEEVKLWLKGLTEKNKRTRASHF